MAPTKSPQHSKGPKECDQSNAIFEGIALGWANNKRIVRRKEPVIYEITDLYIIYNIVCIYIYKYVNVKIHMYLRSLMYGIFTYIWLKSTIKVGKIFHTWSTWVY